MAENKEKKNINKVQVKNKKAYHDYELVEKVEAGISLLGTEVKSLRNGQADLEGSFAKVQGNQCFLHGCKIAPYTQAGDNNHDPNRDKKLLLHRRQINKIAAKLQQRGFTLVPLRIYFNERGLAKVELALARGKRQYDKRRTKTERQQKKEVRDQMKRFK
jgi:SsrA-binding protein